MYSKKSLKMKQLNNWIIVCLSGLLSCTASDVLDDPSGQDNGQEGEQVTLHIQPPVVGGLTVTRAGTENLPAGATLRVAAYQRNAGALGTPVNIATTAPTAEATYEVGSDGSLTACTVDANGKKTGTSSTPFNVYKGTYDFYAVSPARPLTKSGSTYQVSNVQRGEDVMTSTQTGVAITRANATVSLATFARKCARVIVKVVPKEITGTDKKIVVTKLKATSVTLKNISAQSAVLPVGSSGAIAPTAGANATFSNFVAVPSADDPKKLQLTQATNLLFPRSSAKLEVSATVEYQESGAVATTRTLQNTQNTVAFEAGQSYVITLTVDNNASELGITVTAGTTDSTDDSMGDKQPPAVVGNLQVCKKDDGYLSISTGIQSCKNSTAEGHNDWRLPTREELSLCVSTRATLEATAGFVAFVRGNYWSSTSTVSGYYYIVSFNNGSSGGTLGTSSQNVRCVRDNP